MGLCSALLLSGTVTALFSEKLLKSISVPEELLEEPEPLSEGLLPVAVLDAAELVMMEELVTATLVDVAAGVVLSAKESPE